jgi:aryl-alcohol dehydrogenase-like predicted oxidoreductase
MKRLGKTALSVSAVALGAASFGAALDEATSFSILDAYVAAGGNLIDTARIYAGGESEAVLGRWLKRARPQNVIVATKGAHYALGTPTVMRLSRREIESDLDTSLRILGLDCIDFYWLHRDDPAREIGEIIETMESLVRAGKIRYYGASNYRTDRLCAADNYAKVHGHTGFSAVSNQYSVARLNVGRNTNPDPTIVAVDDEALAYHTASGMPLVPFQATARGYFAKLAAGREVAPTLCAAYENAENSRIYRELTAFCEQTGCSMQTATLVATAKTPFQTIPITAVSTVGQMADVAAAIRLLSE